HTSPSRTDGATARPFAGRLTLKVATHIADSFPGRARAQPFRPVGPPPPPTGPTLHLQGGPVSVLVDHAASMLAYRPAKLTAMVVVHDPRVRTSVTRHLWALGVR